MAGVDCCRSVRLLWLHAEPALAHPQAHPGEGLPSCQGDPHFLLTRMPATMPEFKLLPYILNYIQLGCCKLVGDHRSVNYTEATEPQVLLGKQVYIVQQQP